MKSLLKTALFSIAIATLTGCASMPDAPKTQAEMKQLGDDNLLHVPVDITGFIPSKMEIVTEKDNDACITIWCSPFGVDGKKGQITVFTDPKTGKIYDLDGQPVNEKGQRVLNNGYACKVRDIYGNMRVYGFIGTFSETKVDKFCKTSLASMAQTKNRALLLTGFAVGGLGSLASIPVSTITSMISDDTF